MSNPFLSWTPHIYDCLQYNPITNKKTKISEYKKNIAKRVTFLAISILSVCKSFNIAKNLAKNIFVIAKNSYKIGWEDRGELKKIGLFIDSAAKIFFLSSAVFSFLSGLKICAALYLFNSTIKIAVLIDLNEYKKAFNESLDLISNIGLIATMIFTSSELFIATFAFSFCYSIYQASYEFENGLAAEAITRVCLSCIGIQNIMEKIEYTKFFKS